jgi:hypothetical protein
MAYFANIFTGCLTGADAFQCYGNFIIKSELLKSFYSYNFPVIHCYYQILEYFMKKKVPDILNKFRELGVYSDSLLMECVCSFFSKCAPTEFIRYFYNSYKSVD